MSELYYKILKNTHTGYANVTLRQLLDHLVTTYAAIDQFDLEKNQEKMTARYDPNASNQDAVCTNSGWCRLAESVEGQPH